MKECIVSICCLTYNHAPYIRECLEGFLAQQTSFVYEILIHDDASTDDTIDIIKEYEAKYPDLIKPIYQTENQYSKGTKISATFQFPRVQGRYIAICEGDDYWVDPLKLQKQVDFLTSHPDYGLVHTGYKQYTQKEKKFDQTTIAVSEGDVFAPLIRENFIASLTVMFRIEWAHKAKEAGIFIPQFKMGDYPLWLYIAKHTKIGYIDDITSVYRILEESASHFKSPYPGFLFEQSVWEIRYFFCEEQALKQDLERQEKGYYQEQMYLSLFLNDRKLAGAVHAFWKKKGELRSRQVLCYWGVKYPFFRSLVLRKFAKKRKEVEVLLKRYDFEGD